MTLLIQIRSLFFSFSFGIIFSIIVSFFNNRLYNTRIRYQIINAFLISIISCLIYFICVKKINNGIVHTYFILMIILGFYIEKSFLNINKHIKNLVKKIKIKYNKK